MQGSGVVVLFLLGLLGPHTARGQCNPTITKASGTQAPKEICAGDLIFNDDFNEFNLKVWEHEITMSGGGNWEFEVYSNNRSNSFVKDGNLHIRPTLTSDKYDDDFLIHGVLSLYGGSPADACTNPSFWGCERTASPDSVLNPIMSARLRTYNAFSYKYGKLEIRAKMPGGDWLWPALWLLPHDNAYGTWPASGEIDLSEVRANEHLVKNGVNVGVEQTGSTLHFGPYWPLNGYIHAHFDKNTAPGQGYNKDFHRYQMEWTDNYIRFSIDDEVLGTVTPPAGGFWELGEFASANPRAENPWRFATKMAPFDQEFIIVMNVACGGINAFWPDDAENPDKKPWANDSPHASTDFWNGRADWLRTWQIDVNDGEQSSMLVDYVKVWAI